jgi:hypothetical protein
MPVRHAQPQHTVRACACARHTHAPRPRCAPRKGSARRSLRRTAGVEQRDARPDESRSAGHARCAAPDRPVVQPPPSVRTCSRAARSPAHALPGGHRHWHAAASERTGPSPDCNCGTPTRPSVPSAFFCRFFPVPTVRTRGCPPLHCVKARPIQRHVITCAALACRSPAGAKLSSSKPTRQSLSPRPKHPCTHIFGLTPP